MTLWQWGQQPCNPPRPRPAVLGHDGQVGEGALRLGRRRDSRGSWGTRWGGEGSVSGGGGERIGEGLEMAKGGGRVHQETVQMAAVPYNPDL